MQFKVHGHLCKTLNYSSGRTGKLPKLWEHLAEVPHNLLCILLVCLEETIYYSLNSRYLLEGVTGHYTGSMYNDISLRKKGFYGEGVPADAGIVVTVKTHGHTTGKGAHEERPAQVSFCKNLKFVTNSLLQIAFNHHAEVNHSAILLIRNPYEAIIGHRNLDR